jgi:hypothetical protein
MNKKSKIISKLIAPCGMDCGLCLAYLRDKNKCPGCNAPDNDKRITCVRCKIKNCKFIKGKKAKFCFECECFPCDRLKHLDKRYKTKYHMSMIENLENIKSLGINKFVKNEDIKWTCSKCGNIICVHKGCCISSGKKI